MHIGLHYVEQIKEYAVSNNCNVLAGEDKHRDYKNLVQRTNHRDVEKTLLLQESFRRTLQLVLGGSFHSSDLRLTQKIQELYTVCPALFNNLLRMDQEEADEDDDSPNYSVKLEPTKYHMNPKIFGRLSSSKMSEKVGIQFTNLSKLELLHPFLNKLRESYDADWNKPSVLEPGHRPILFYNKLTFSIRDRVRRISLMEGDIIQYRGAELGRITTIFIHEMGGIKRIFFTLIPLHHVMHDRLLNLPILQENSDNYTIVGLPAVQKAALHDIPILDSAENGGHLVYEPRATRYLHCTWDVSFL
ncbi:hypothetical protein ACJ73_05183 [Blastomyces percursus]|uniref:Uncharacterized protein n=1 Tax=Blastomyces percursus TaxID=1658174 RepID=A0A1J9QTA3_9EURO|nr:hypothetical protein ACJ73_05183 [Blastomyces percursus]